MADPAKQGFNSVEARWIRTDILSFDTPSRCNGTAGRFIATSFLHFLNFVKVLHTVFHKTP